MCRPVKCKQCNKTTWAGCGQHVAAVKATVPAGQWCTCGAKAGKGSAAGAAGGESGGFGGFLKSLFGR
nr:hypothetical protein [Canibacter oris]